MKSCEINHRSPASCLLNEAQSSFSLSLSFISFCLLCVSYIALFVWWIIAALWPLRPPCPLCTSLASKSYLPQGHKCPPRGLWFPTFTDLCLRYSLVKWVIATIPFEVSDHNFRSTSRLCSQPIPILAAFLHKVLSVHLFCSLILQLIDFQHHFDWGGHSHPPTPTATTWSSALGTLWPWMWTI